MNGTRVMPRMPVRANEEIRVSVTKDITDFVKDSEERLRRQSSGLDIDRSLVTRKNKGVRKHHQSLGLFIANGGIRQDKTNPRCE